MKKKIISLFMILTTITCLTACGNANVNVSTKVVEPIFETTIETETIDSQETKNVIIDVSNVEVFWLPLENITIKDTTITKNDVILTQNLLVEDKSNSIEYVYELTNTSTDSNMYKVNVD